MLFFFSFRFERVRYTCTFKRRCIHIVFVEYMQADQLFAKYYYKHRTHNEYEMKVRNVLAASFPEHYGLGLLVDTGVRSVPRALI